MRFPMPVLVRPKSCPEMTPPRTSDGLLTATVRLSLSSSGRLRVCSLCASLVRVPPRVIRLPPMTYAPAVGANVIGPKTESAVRSFVLVRPTAPSNVRESPDAGGAALPSQLAGLLQRLEVPPPSQIRSAARAATEPRKQTERAKTVISRGRTKARVMAGTLRGCGLN